MTPLDIAEDMRAKMAIALSGKYAKQALIALESINALTPEVRKAILDAFNDYKRELDRVLLNS